MSILASASVTQNANVSAGGTLDIEATAGSFAMLDAVTATSTANLRVLVNTSILIGGLSGENIALDAGTSIDTAGITHIDLTADGVQLIAGSFVGQAFGAGNGPLSAGINSLAAEAVTGGLYLDNDKSLTIKPVSAIDVNRVEIDGTPATQAGVARSEIDVKQSARVTADGNLTIDSAVDAEGGQLLLKALSGELAVNASVGSGLGLTALANGAVALSAAGLFSAGGTLDVQSATAGSR